MEPHAAWTIAAVQMDCRLGDLAGNLAIAVRHIDSAADHGARLVVLPECALSGYGLTSREQALLAAESLPGTVSKTLEEVCAARKVFALVGLLERNDSGSQLYNACALVGPQGLIASYRKIHLPCIGVDRFVDPGDRPYAVHDLGGMRLGVGICFDLSFPEASRVLALAGADLIALPTNWATYSTKMAELVCRVRALENHVYFACVNRVGDETGFHYIGQSSICDFNGDFMVVANHDREAIITATIDPVAARQKTVVTCAGEYEIDRINWRRPGFYGSLVKD